MADGKIYKKMLKFGNDKKIKVPFSRNGLWLLFNELGFNCGCEVGVAMGLNAEKMCSCIPNLNLSLVDIYEKDPEYPVSLLRKPKRIYRWARLRMKRCEEKYGCKYKFLKMTSMEAVKTFPDNSLDYVYIDANCK
jgi:hypothetical protein